MLSTAVSGVSCAGWKVSSAFMRYGAAGVEFTAGSPPAESVVSDSTRRPI